MTRAVRVELFTARVEYSDEYLTKYSRTRILTDTECDTLDVNGK